MVPGKQAELLVPEISDKNPADKYEFFLMSWQGRGVDDSPFNGSHEFRMNQIRIER